jgi:hypothetical protein
VSYQLGPLNPRILPRGGLDYMLLGTWFYVVPPPRPAALFPFFGFGPTPISNLVGRLSLPPYYLPNQPTGGLLPMTPLVVFLAGLPWIWRRRPTLLGALGAPLLILAVAGLAGMLFVSYEFSATGERYQVDFATLFLLGALGVWLSLSRDARGRHGRLLRGGGGLLAVVGCLFGLLIGFTGPSQKFVTTHRGTWNELVDITSPISTALAKIAGRPLLGETSAPELSRVWVGDQIYTTIISPGAEEATLLMTATPALKRHDEAPLELGIGPSEVLVRGPGHARFTLPIPRRRGVVRIPMHLSSGVNRLTISPLASALNLIKPATAPARQLLVIDNLSIAGVL